MKLQPTGRLSRFNLAINFSMIRKPARKGKKPSEKNNDSSDGKSRFCRNHSRFRCRTVDASAEVEMRLKARHCPKKKGNFDAVWTPAVSRPEYARPAGFRGARRAGTFELRDEQKDGQIDSKGAGGCVDLQSLRKSDRCTKNIKRRTRVFTPPRA